MLLNLAAIAFVALFLNWCCEKIKIPGLLGMIVAGIILGPFCCNFIAPKLLEMSAELRSAALIVILIRAGLGINRATLNKVGGAAVKISIIPCLIEAMVIIVAARWLLGFSWLSAGILAFVLAAVSLAVVVPEMLNLKEKGYGRNREIPTLMLAGSSLDNVVSITIFGIFLQAGTTENFSAAAMLYKVPLGIVIGIALGAAAGWILALIYKNISLRDTRKVIIFLIAAVGLHALSVFEETIPIATLLGIMTMGFVILELDSTTAHHLAAKFNQVWIFAEILLFVLIGAQVNLITALQAGTAGILIILLGLAGRSLGVWLSLLRSGLNRKEKLFCIFAYLPKATVQAAIGAIPLSLGIPGGEIILAIAVLSIIITAPPGAVLIRATHHRLLEKPSPPQ